MQESLNKETADTLKHVCFELTGESVNHLRKYEVLPRLVDIMTERNISLSNLVSSGLINIQSKKNLAMEVKVKQHSVPSSERIALLQSLEYVEKDWREKVFMDDI